MSILVRIAWRNLLRSWRRSAAVLGAIALGLAGSLILIGWGRGMFYQMTETAIRTQLGHIAVHARGYQADPDVQRGIAGGGRALLAAIAARPGAAVSARLVGDGLVQSARANARAAIVGALPSAEARVSLVAGSLVEGEYLSDADPGRRASALPPVLIGRAMAERLSIDLGDKVVLHVAGEGGLAAFRVRGIFRTAWSEFDRATVFVRLADAQALHGVGDSVTELAVLLERDQDLRAFQTWLEDAAVKLEPALELEVLSWQQREPRLAAMLEFMRNVEWIFYAVVFVAMAFGIANALLMAVFERVREFGLLRALGLPGSRVLALVLIESFLLTLLGTALGIALGGGIILWLGHTGLDLTLMSDALRELGAGNAIYPRMGPEDLVSPVALSAITALLAGLWPALRALKLRPAQALRRN